MKHNKKLAHGSINYVFSCKSRHGAIVLEAALVMPLIMLLLIGMLSLQASLTAEIKLRSAMAQTAAEISLLIPLIDMTAQGIPIDQWFDGHLELSDHVDPGFLDDPHLTAILADGLFDLASSAVLSPFIHARINYWLEKNEATHQGFTNLLPSRSLYLDFRPEKNQLWLCISYDLKMAPMRIKRYHQTVVPLWIGSSDRPVNDDESDQVWLLDNFSRGQILRDYYGANLPYNFPVIAIFNQGHVTSIKSMDLTAPTYQQKSEIRRRIRQQIDQLANFQGSSYQQQGQQINIDAEAITSKCLLMIIPQNSSQSALDVLGDLKMEAAGSGIDLQWRFHGISTRYEVDDP